VAIDVFCGLATTPLPPFVLIVSDEFLLFRIDRNHRPPSTIARLTSRLMCRNWHPGPDGLPLFGLAVALQTITQVAQILGDLLVADSMVRQTNSPANVLVLLQVHRNGDSGSPRVNGSTNDSKRQAVRDHGPLIDAAHLLCVGHAPLTMGRRSVHRFPCNRHP